MADDELNPGQDPIPEEEETEANEASSIAELEGLIAQKDGALTKANARITELEQATAQSDERHKATNDSLAEAVASYKKVVIEAHPEVPEEFINGDSIDSVNESLQQAQGMISRVRQGLEAEISAVRVPVGAPQRTPPDLSGLSPREKIQYAIGSKR